MLDSDTQRMKKINKQTVDEIIEISKLPYLEIDGLFTHFAIADDDDDEYTMLQYNRFNTLCSRIREAGGKSSAVSLL